MAEVSAYRYRVFLACSPGDMAAGKWLRAALESFRVDKDMVGRPTLVGRVPKTLRPIYFASPPPAIDDPSKPAIAPGVGAHQRLSSAKLPIWPLSAAGGAMVAPLGDDDEMLTSATFDALQASQFLVVLCSPAAARSRRIDEIIRRFNAMHRDDRVIPVIVAGEPGHHSRDCFPGSLRYRLSAKREATDECGEPIADARPQPDGEGRTWALERVVARLIGLPFETAAPRFERARARRRTIRQLGIAATIALAVAGQGTIMFARQELARNEALLDYTVAVLARMCDRAVVAAHAIGLPQRLTVNLLVASEGALRDLVALGGEAPRLRYRKAALLIGLTRHYTLFGERDRPYRRAGEAEGLMHALAGEVPGNPAWQRDLADAFDDLGDVLNAQGRVQAALAAYRLSAAIAERLTTDELRQGEPAGDRHRRDLAARYVKTGDVAVAQGTFDDALVAYQASLAINQRLAATEPDDPRWRYGLLIAHEKIGDVFRVQAELEPALESYRSAQGIAQALLAAEPGHLGWRQAFAQSQIKVGDVMALAGKREEALANYRYSNAIAERITAERADDPAIASWQNHLAVTHDRIGSVLQAQGDLVAALREYRTAAGIAERAVDADPSNSAWLRDLGIAHEHIGEALQALGDLNSALQAFENKRAIVNRLVDAEPLNPGWQYDLGNSHARIGFVLEARGQFDAALKEYEACLAIGRRFVAADPGNAQWQRDLAASYQRLAEARLRMGKTAQALAELRRGRDIMAALIEIAYRASLDTSPDLPQWTQDLDRFDSRIAVLSGRPPTQPGTPPIASTTAACESCPPAGGAVLVASDARKRDEALAAADAKRAN